MIIFIYYLSYFSQIFFPIIINLSLIISFFFLYDQIINKKDDLFKIFLILLPSLSPLNIFNLNLNNATYFFFFSIDPLFFASFFYFYRNFIINFFKKNNLNYFLYLALFVYSFVHLFFLYFSGQSDNQGITYSFRAILYVSCIFTIYNNDLVQFKEQLKKIIYLSMLILLLRNIFNVFDFINLGGHLIFIAVSFPAILIFYKFNYLNLSLYLLTVYTIFNYSITTICIFLLSNFLIFIRNFKIFMNKISLVFLINFPIIILISFFYYDYLLNFFYTDNVFNTKFLFDRLPLFMSSIKSLELFQFQSKEIILLYKNIISTEQTWSSGSHNYFLTLASKMGIVPISFLFIILNTFFLRLFRYLNDHTNINDKFSKLLFISFTACFSVFSTVGNAFAESTGFVFFLLLGALNSIYMLNKS